MVDEVTEQDLIQAVLEATRRECGEGLTTPEIARATGIDEIIVRRYLHQLKDAGVIVATKVLRHTLDDAWRRTPGYALARSASTH